MTWQRLLSSTSTVKPQSAPLLPHEVTVTASAIYCLRGASAALGGHARQKLNWPPWPRHGGYCSVAPVSPAGVTASSSSS